MRAADRDLPPYGNVMQTTASFPARQASATEFSLLEFKPDSRYQHYWRAFRTGRFSEALEAARTLGEESQGRNRTFYQGLGQVAGSLYHLNQGEMGPGVSRPTQNGDQNSEDDEIDCSEKKEPLRRRSSEREYGVRVMAS